MGPRRRSTRWTSIASSHHPKTPWVEGNGYEGPLDKALPGAAGTDDAYGVAWAGAGDNPDPAAANNTTQPPFDPVPVAQAIVNQGTDGSGTVIRWDITPLVNAWIAGTTPNEGILLRDTTTDGLFRGVRFGSREGIPNNLPGAVDGPVVEILAQANTPPTVKAPSDQSSSEGTSHTFDLGSFSDPAGSPWTVDVKWGDGTPDTIFTTSTSGSLGTQDHTYGEEGSLSRDGHGHGQHEPV